VVAGAKKKKKRQTFMSGMKRKKKERTPESCIGLIDCSKIENKKKEGKKKNPLHMRLYHIARLSKADDSHQPWK